MSKKRLKMSKTSTKSAKNTLIYIFFKSRQKPFRKVPKQYQKKITKMGNKIEDFFTHF